MDPQTAKSRLNLGSEAVMLQHVHRKLSSNQRALDRWREGGMDKAGLPRLPATEDDMLVLGDNTVIHQQSSPSPSTPSRGLGLLKAALVAAAAASGVGIPVAASIALPYILDALRPATATPADPIDHEPILLPGRPAPPQS